MLPPQLRAASRSECVASLARLTTAHHEPAPFTAAEDVMQQPLAGRIAAERRDM
jgi:hypothetical protein